jgi:LysM repeat protein
MYYKLPIKERMDLMKSYKKANKNMSYSDMVNDYNTSYQRFDNGGKKNTNVAESTFVKSPHIINLSKDTKVIDPDKNTLNHMYALQLLKKHNVDVDSTGNVLNSLGLNSVAYYNPITRTINYKHDPNKNPKTEYSEMVMKELPHAIQSDSLGVVPFLKNTFTEGAQDYLFEKDPNSRYYNTSKIEGHAHNTLEQKLYYERQAKLYNAKDLKYGGIQKFGNGGEYKVKSGDNLSTIAKNYNTDISTIQKLNNIQDVNKIGIGQNIILPERQNNIVQQPVNTQQSTNLNSYDFNTAFKIARQELGPNKIFEHNGKKFGTNLKGETFIPDKQELANHNMLNDPTLTHLTDQNKKVKSIYTSKETVKLQPTWKESTEIEKQNQEFNKLKNAELINKYQSIRNPNEKYIIVDKKKGKMHVYLGGKEIESYNVGTGENKGDEQTRTWVDKETHKTDWSKGNKQTGAGVYTISFIDEHNKHYGNVPSFHLKNENGVEVPTAIHAGFGDRLKRIANNDLNNNDPESKKDTRFSNGCINGLCKDMTDLYQNDLKADKKGNQGTKVFVLPDDDNNFYQIKNGKLNLTTKEYNPNVAYSPKNLKANPVKINVTNEENNTPQVKGMAYTLEKLKSTLMKDGKVDNDTYNKLSKLVIGLALQETKGGEDYRIRSGSLKIPFTNKETDQGLVNYLKDLKGSNSINSRGLTQIKYDAQNDELKAQFKKYGVTKDNLNDGVHASIATMLMLSYMYNNELPNLKEKLKKQGISDEEALLYLNQGKKSEIVKGTATPSKNIYIQNVKNFGKNISVQEESY